MSILFLLIPLSLLLAIGFVIACVQAIHKGQYQDLESPRWRLLFEDTKPSQTNHSDSKTKKNIESNSRSKTNG